MQPCFLWVLDIGSMRQGKALCDLDLRFPSGKPSISVVGNATTGLAREEGGVSKAGMDMPCLGTPHVVRPVSEWQAGDRSGGLCV